MTTRAAEGAARIVGRVHKRWTFCAFCDHEIPQGEVAAWYPYFGGDARRGAGSYAIHATGPCGPRTRPRERLDAPDPRDAAEARVAVAQALRPRHAGGVLSDRERMIIAARYGLADREPMTLAALGLHFGITRERARQIQRVAEEKLRDAMDPPLALAPARVLPLQRRNVPAPAPLVTSEQVVCVPDWLAG